MAVDDAYSRYVMTLEPLKYLRFRDMAVGHVVARDEVWTGPGPLGTGPYPGRAKYHNPESLVADNVGAGSLCPGLAAGGATHVRFRNGLYLHVNQGGAGSDTNMSHDLTSNSWAYHRGHTVNGRACSFNYWYRVPMNQGGVNDRIMCIRTLEDWGYTQGSGINMFSWNNGVDNGLCEILFKKGSQLLGTSNMYNIGNYENYRYLSYVANNTVNTVNMMTLTFGLDRACLYQNGQKQKEFAWNPDKYGVMILREEGGWFLGAQGDYLSEYAYADMSEFSAHNKTLSETEVAELYFLGINGRHVRSLVGTVTDILGNPLARTVRAHSHRDGRWLGETISSGIDGTFTIYTPASHTDHIYAVALDDLTLAPDYNAAIQSRLVAQ